MVTLLDGKTVAAQVVEELKAEVAALKAKGVEPTLALVLTGTDENSARYVKLKVKKAEEVGIKAEFHHLEKTTQHDLVKLVKQLSADPKVHGVMVQLSLAEGLHELEVVSAIAPEKDVDGLSPVTFGKLMMGEPAFNPAGVEAILELFKRYSIDPGKKHWVMAGHTNIVNRPLGAVVWHLKSNVTFVSATCPYLAEHTKRADVIVTEVYRKNAITADMVKPGAVVIDNGNNYEGKKVYGDADTEAVSAVASAITPVPGGVGPLLVTMLLRNTVRAASK
jgi:methylenetetrahydrofolate dehydrogenase (NADP+)/methenyltetrahydrofolate cyclohydrolase